jgi:hypothetical protein
VKDPERHRPAGILDVQEQGAIGGSAGHGPRRQAQLPIFGSRTTTTLRPATSTVHGPRRGAVLSGVSERKETRGWHIREDYPERDDVDHLKWIILKDSNGEVALSTERVPIERYTYKP